MDTSSLQLNEPEYADDRIINVGVVRTETDTKAVFRLASGQSIWQSLTHPKCKPITLDLLEQYGFLKDGQPLRERFGVRVDVPCRVKFEKVLLDGQTYVNVSFAKDGGHDEAAMDEALFGEPEEVVVVAKAASKTPAPSRRRQ
jgi:hypothetical protein